MAGLIEASIIRPELATSFATGYRQADLARREAQQAQMQNELSQQRLAQGRQQMQFDEEKLKQLRQDREDMLRLQGQLRDAGKDTDLNKVFDALIQSGNTDYVVKGIEGKRRLSEQTRAEGILRQYAPELFPAPAAAPAAAPASYQAPTLEEGQAAAGYPVSSNALAPATTLPTNAMAPAPAAALPTNAMVPAPAAGAAPMADDPRVVDLRKRYMVLSSLDDPRAKTAAAAIKAELDDLTKTYTVGNQLVRGGKAIFTAPPTPQASQVKEVSNGIEKWTTIVDPNTKTQTEVPGSRVKVQLTPYESQQLQVARERLSREVPKLSGEDQTLIAAAILNGKLDPNAVNGRNAPMLASALRVDPDADLKALNEAAVAGKSSARTLGTTSANIAMASSEAEKMIGIAQGYVKQLNPNEIPALNAAGNYVAKNTGDTRQVALAQALNALVNTYARAINPRGVPTVSDKNHAREIINTSLTSGQFDAVFNVMRQEMEASLASPAAARETLGIGGKKPAPAAPSGAPKIGEVQDGYRFKGGNPADRNSWEKQ